jgi:phospholipid/cholesterol/gamma-HCH transport system ATP-binding protein
VSNASENTNLLRLVDVEKKLGRAKVLKGVNLEIRQGERMVIIGRSGGGKSVLLKHIIGLMRPDSGQVWFRDQDLSQLNEEQLVPLRKETGMLFQNGALFDSLTVGENVAFPLREKGNRDEEAIRSEVARALKIVDLPNQESKWPSELSGGMRKRVALARAAIAKPALMLYDEPTSGLDPVVADSINKLMVRLGQEARKRSATASPSSRTGGFTRSIGPKSCSSRRTPISIDSSKAFPMLQMKYSKSSL